MSETNPVIPLRQRMIEDMAARKLDPHTQRSHIYSCKRFAAWLKRSPDMATAEDVRLFQLHLVESGGKSRFAGAKKPVHEPPFPKRAANKQIRPEADLQLCVTSDRPRCRADSEVKVPYFSRPRPRTAGPRLSALRTRREWCGTASPVLGLQKIVDEALAIAALVTPMAPTKMRLSAQTTSRLNQLFEMNLNPSHSCTAKATIPPLTIIAVAWTIETAIAVPRFPRMSAAAAWWPASCSPAAADTEIDGQQHQARAMGRRDGERPERQLCRLDTGQETRMAAGDQQVDARRYDQQPGANADFMLPSDQGGHNGERRQDARHRQEVPGAERTERRDQVPSPLAHQPGGNRQRPAHPGVDAVIDAAGDYGQPEAGLHPLEQSARSHGRIAERVG